LWKSLKLAVIRNWRRFKHWLGKGKRELERKEREEDWKR